VLVMCGIARQLALTENNRIDKAELITMVRVMTHRGRMMRGSTWIATFQLEMDTEVIIHLYDE
jgi:asparagine synthetase B (glutamine-hydrolysing)